MRKWTKDLFWEVAEKYPSKEALRKGNKGAHRAGEREGWLYEFPFKEQHKPNNYWNRERCSLEAKKFNSRKEFHAKSSSAYTAALKNGWLDDYSWFISKDMIRNRCVYSYEFVMQKTVYVGLTQNKRLRHLQHLGKTKSKWRTAVYLFAHANNIKIPEPIYYYDNLTAAEAQEQEHSVLTNYTNAGWTILNKAKTGKGVGSLGGHNYMWDKEACEKEASKYKNKKDFHRYNAGAYTSALKNGWLNSFFPESSQPMVQKPKGYWDVFDNNKEEASKYKSRTAFRDANLVAYRKASSHGWIDIFFPKTINNH